MKVPKQYAIFILFIALFDVFSISLSVDLIYLFTLNIWMISVLYAFLDIKHRAIYMIFLISFFVFLLGGHFCYEYLDMNIAHYYGDTYYRHSNICLLISLTSLLFTTVCAQRVRIGNSSQSVMYEETALIESDYVDNYVLLIRKSSKILFIITYIFWMYELLDTVFYVLANSYYSYYTDFESSAPFAVRCVAAMAPACFYVFLATMPSKKECKLPILLYLLYAVISIFTGKRGYVVFIALFLVLYFIIRHYVGNNTEVWIKRWYIYIAIAAVPIISVFLYMRGNNRFGDNQSATSFLNMFFSFFQTQGVSSSVIRMELYYEQSLRSDALYSFYGIVKTFRTNTLLKLIFNPKYDFSYIHHSVALATKSNSLDAALSYLGLYNYLQGAGMGSCYVAELYHDFGYIGIFVGNSIYAIIMNWFGKVWVNYRKHSVWVVAIGFVMVEAFIKAPRWNYDIIFQYCFDLGTWMAFGAIIALASLLKRTTTTRLIST